MFMVLSFCVAFLKPRSNETKTGAKKVATKFSFAALKEWPFSLFMVGSFFTYWPAYFGFYFVGVYQLSFYFNATDDPRLQNMVKRD